MSKKESRSCSIEDGNLLLMSFAFENEGSAKAIETRIVSRAVIRILTVGWGPSVGNIKIF